jgi:hypothetical protein
MIYMLLQFEAGYGRRQIIADSLNEHELLHAFQTLGEE